jgi:UPF0755 protein
MRKILPSILFLFLFTGASFGACIAGGALYFHQAGPLVSPKTLIIPAGSSTHTIAATLAEAGIIRHPTFFWFFSKLSGHGQKLKAGEYLFTPAIPPYAIIDMLVSGRAIIHRFTVPEGTSTAQVIAMLMQEETLLGTITPDSIKEGSLLPDTYFFSYGEAKQKLLDRMQKRMQSTLAELWQTRQPNLPFSTPEEALILASIIEKETGISTEQREVSAVFINRLRKNMKLQSDPTVIYALTKGEKELQHSLTRQDLRTPSPINTYFATGLPPTPITNPGKASIIAALHPANTNALYFVADGKGGHRFAATLEEHNHNVDLYRSSLVAE